MTHLAKTCLLLSLLGGAGCADSPSNAAVDAGVDAGTLPSVQVSCAQMDVLFVIDNSPSMAQEQQNLSDNFDGFIASLRSFQEGEVDFRVGVTTTSFPYWLEEDPAASGALLKTPDMNEPWLSSGDPELVSKFRVLATVGTNGSHETQPLKAVSAALIDRVLDGKNANFMRESALLALVMVTDEDDLSSDVPENLGPMEPTPVGQFVSELDRLKQERENWSAAVFAGGTAPTCNSAFGTAVYAPRLRAFVDLAGNNAVFHSICDGDLKSGLDAALATFKNACEFLLY